MYTCCFCLAESEPTRWEAREMFFGTRATFRYAECATCGSVALEDPPAAMGEHYPGDYYSFQPRPPPRGFKRFKQARIASFVREGRGLLGRLLFRTSSLHFLKLLRRLPFEPPYGALRILDVGCGAGSLLGQLAGLGFEHLEGVDPFLGEGATAPEGVRVRRMEVGEVRGEVFDLVLFEHSLEHVPDPEASLRAAAGLLAPGARLVVRQPTTSSEAWREYRTDWVQLDPPRHMCIPSLDGMAALVGRVGLEVEEVFFDSDDFQYWGSELYRRDLSLVDPATGRGRVKDDHFSPEEQRAFKARAREANRRGVGDQAGWVLRRAGT